MVKRPIPHKTILNSVIYAGHEVDGQPEVMGRLSASRFRRADREQVVLPLEAAERLKDFEAGLRLVGLIRPDEALFQSSEDAYKFRVERTNASIDLAHSRSSVEVLNGPTNTGMGYRAKALSAELFSQEPLSAGRDRLGAELRALSAQRAAKPRT